MRLPLPVRRLIAKLGFRLHIHVVQIGPKTYKKDGRAHWHRRTNPHYLGGVERDMRSDPK